jgi:hypothetical protein
MIKAIIKRGKRTYWQNACFMYGRIGSIKPVAGVDILPLYRR